MAQQIEVLVERPAQAQGWWRSFFSTYRTPLLIGLALRLLLIPTATYTDLHAIAYAVHLLPFHGVLNIYELLHDIDLSNSPVPLLGPDFYTYPPLSYFTLGGLMGLLRPLYTDAFSGAISMQLEEFVTYRPQVFLWLTLYKLPFLAFDLGIAALLARLFYTPSDKRLAVALWMLNPAPLVGAYLFGQFDVIPAFFVLRSFLAARRGSLFWAALLLGIGASFKTYPLMLLPVLAIIMGHGLRQRVLLVLLGLAPFVLSLLPFAGSSVAINLILNSGPAQRVFQASLNLGDVLDMNGAVYVFVVLYVLVLLHAWYRGAGRAEGLWRYQLAVLLLAYGLSYSHLQWLVWLAPFMILDWVRHPQNRVVHVFLIGSAFGAALVWQVGPPLEFFQPLGLPWVWTSLWDLVSPYMDPLQFANIMRSIFAGAALFWVYMAVLREGSAGASQSPP